MKPRKRSVRPNFPPQLDVRGVRAVGIDYMPILMPHQDMPGYTIDNPTREYLPDNHAQHPTDDPLTRGRGIASTA